MNTNQSKIKTLYKRIRLALLRRTAIFFKSDEKFLKKLFKVRMGKELNLENPTTFSEKLQWLKIHNRHPQQTIMVDKVWAKEYVAKIIGEQYIIPTLAVYDKPENIDFDALPNQFVLKCTHDSGGIVICKDKSKLNYKEVRNKFKKWLKTNYYYQNREWPYKDVKPRIIAELYMEDESNEELKDFKIFCFNGVPKYCQVIAGRKSMMTIDFYDKNWVHQDFHEPRIYPFSLTGHKAPLNYDTMLDLATKLSDGQPFLRVDFYEINGKLFWGELTFYPTSGMGGFSPDEWDYKFGSWITLPTEIHNDKQKY